MDVRETVRERIAKNIVKYRKNKNMTQQQLADAVGASRVSTVSAWERGYNAPDIEMLIKVCDVLDVSLDDVFGQQKAPLINGWARVQQYGDEHGFHPDDVLLILDANERLKARAKKAEEEKK